MDTNAVLGEIIELPPTRFERNPMDESNGMPHLEWTDELSPLDYMMFRADMDPRTRTSMMWIETLDVVPDRERFRETLDRASRTVPRLRQHVVAPLLPLTAPRWVIDPEFDLDYHIRWTALPPPGDFRSLLDVAETLHAAPLDLGRPLWEVTVIEGLDEPDAKAALCWKLSHTVTDGVAGMVLDAMIRSGERDTAPAAMPPIPAQQDMTPLDLTRQAVRRLPVSLLRDSIEGVGRAVKTISHVVTDPGEAVSDATTFVDEVRKLIGSSPAAPSPLLRRRGLNRRYEAFDVPFRDLRAAGKSHGCSVNDAYLAALGGMLRCYHEELGMPVDAITVGVPVNRRSSTNGGDDAGNQWGVAVIALPVSEPDPIIRMKLVHESIQHAKNISSPDPTQVVAPLLAWVPRQLLAGIGPGSLGIDVQASSVPGHPGERYIAGAKIVRNVACGPLPGVAMMATMVSMSGRCFVGLNYDTDAITDGAVLARCLEKGFDEVLGAA